jgi:predicted nucleotidyltransferase
MTEALKDLVAALAALPEVEAVMLGGSRAAGCADARSDYDVYVYLSVPLALEQRRAALAPHLGDMEWDRRFWETEDDGELAKGTEIELIYRSQALIEAQLDTVLLQHAASTGYTTCLWANVAASLILFDRSGWGAALLARSRCPYPRPLAEAIVAKNFPLLAQARCAYAHQIAKALARDDALSVNHRVAALLASWFDIVFAVNERPHPGEKRLLEWLDRLPAAPEGASARIRKVLSQTAAMDPGLNDEIAALERTTRTWLAGQGFAC